MGKIELFTQQIKWSLLLWVQEYSKHSYHILLDVYLLESMGLKKKQKTNSQVCKAIVLHWILVLWK